MSNKMIPHPPIFASETLAYAAALFVLAGLALLGFALSSAAPCSWFDGFSPPDVPARCLPGSFENAGRSR